MEERDATAQHAATGDQYNITSLTVAVATGCPHSDDDGGVCDLLGKKVKIFLGRK